MKVFVLPGSYIIPAFLLKALKQECWNDVAAWRYKNFHDVFSHINSAQIWLTHNQMDVQNYNIIYYTLQ